MKKRYILLICLIVCLICSAQTVIAGEIDTNDTKQDSIQTTDIDQVSNDNHVLSSIQDNDLLNTTEDSFTQLNNLLSDTTKTTFDLSNNYIYTSSDGDALKNGITISRSITINGNGKIIDGNHQARIFNILAGCSVTLNGITFINGYASNGGAIYSDGILNMNHCKFINNTATNDGGAVYFEATPSSLTYLEFTSNHADYDGGAMFYHEKITGTHDEGLKHSTFTNNTAGNQGGALCLDGHDGKIINCTFTGNNATSDGGAIMFDGANWGVYDSTFTNNTAINRRGGAIYLEDGINTDIERCTFKYNFAGRNGGAIDWYDGAHDGQLINSTFEYNAAKSNGGAVYWRGHDGEITGCNFTHNRALGLTLGTYGNIGDGGAIMWSGSNGTVTNCRFIDNEAKRSSSSNSSGRGGAVFIQENGNINNDNTTFIDCYFRNNTAGTNGGAIDWHQGASNGTIIHCEFINNTANRSGGAVFWFGIKGTIKDSNFTGNDAYGLVEAIDSYGDLTYGGYGGAIMWTGSVGYVTNCTFKYNEAQFNDATTTGGRGGAVYLQGSTQGNCTDTVFDKCIFIGNIAGTNGGAIDWHKDAHDGLVNNSLFEDNRAYANGGAVYWRGHHGDIYNSNFTNNKALGVRSGTYGNIGDGGAIIWAGINGTVYNCRFEDNEAIKNPNSNASGRGGAVYVRNCTHGNDNTTFEKCYFRNNTAGLNGGAVDWHEGAHNGLVDNCTFINNTAKRSGGAIFWNGHNGTVKYSNFYNNYALGIVNATSVHGSITYGGDGGAIMWSGSLGKVLYSNFVNNTAAARGGGVFLQGSDIEKKCENIKFNHSYFANNVAGTNGGAIDWNNEAIDGLVEDVKFINNTAKRSGGAIFWRGFNGTVKNSTFRNNRATGDYLEYDMNLTYDNVVIINQNSTANITEKGKLYVLNYTLGNGMLKFESYVVDKDGEHLLIDEEIVRVDDEISPVDWGIDQFFGGDGGTILWMGDVGLVDNCTFIGSNSRRRGGGAYMTGSDNVTYNNCYFENCTSGTNGGGLDWLAGANYGRIYNCVFNHTRAARSAGAIYYDGDSGRMENITIIGTKAWGGSLDWSDDHMTHYIGWDSSHWDTNTTGGDGGAIMITGDHEYIYNVTFTNCIATGRGGAVFLQDNYNVTFVLCVFKNNRAEGTANNTYNDDYNTTSGLNKFLTGNGGAIGFDYGARLGVIKNSEFINNTAVRLGGAISFAKGSKDDTIEYCTFTNNTAYRSGGAISRDGENGNMIWCNFTNNSALGTDIDVNLFNLTSLSLIKNVTSISEINSDKYLYVLVGYNGTIKTNYTMYVYKDGKPVYLEFTTEVGPSPTDWAMDEYFGGDGGTIFWRGDYGTVDYCNFVNSNSERRGGGAYMTGSDYITFQNCNFTNCTSGTNGGGLDWLAGANYGKIYNCIFNHTCAARSAGAIYYDGWYGELINITIIGTVSNGGTLKTSEDGRVNYAGWDSSHWDTNTTGGDAGAIMFTGNHEYVYNVTFTDCFSIGRGGAIFLQDNENVTIELCKFINNHANGTATNTWKNYTQERDDSNNDTKLNPKLTGHGGAVAFDVNAKDCKILYSKFYENSARRNGGAINFDEGSVNNTIKHCEFENNTVYDDGGAINFDHGSDLCSVYNCTFYNNTGLGRLGSTTKGGTICLTGSNITIADSTFTLGIAYANTTEGAKLNETDGGALFVTGNDVIIRNTTFINCSTPNYAGAIKIIGNTTMVDNCTFENCSAPNLAGAIYVQGNSVTINGSSFHICHSDIAGAIYIQGENANVIDSEIIDCSSITSAGAIHIFGNHTDINGTSFVNCTTAGTHGGAICISGEYTIISNSTFENCQAQYLDLVHKEGAIGGAIHISGDNATITQSVFNNNFATDDGGAIYVSGVDCKLYNSTFSFNRAGDDGGAILWEGGNGFVYNSTFKNNRALGLNGNSAKGGALNIVGHDSVVTKSHFEMNDAKLDGGAIYATGNNINITDSTFDRCNVTVTTQEYYGHGGGAVFVEGNYSLISNSNFTRCHGGEGGVIYVQGHHTTIDGISTDFTYASNGGVVYVKGTDALISNSNFTRGNATLANGGSIFVEGSNANITGCILKMGQATHGGGSIFVDGINTNIEKSSFANNGADVHGGSIYIEGANAKITDCNMTQSHANQLGGIIYIANGQNAVINGSLLSISYAQKGGAVYIDGKDASIINSNITDTYARNSVSSYADGNLGGAVYIKGNNANISGSIFDSAHAYRGGTIYLEGSYCTVTDSVLNNSYTVDDGGGIYSTGSYSNVYNSNITNNYAGGNGGGIYWYGGTNSKHNHVVGCTFINNSAHAPGNSLTYGGGGIYWSSQGEYGLVKDCVFIRNYAETQYKADGGAILWDQSSHGVIDNCFFDGNYVTSQMSTTTTDGNVWVQGGAVFLRVYTNYTITNCVFKNCWSAKEAGALYLSARGNKQKSPLDIYVENVTFINNTAYGVGGLNNNGGGALMVKEVKYIELNNLTFINNTANQGGALTSIKDVDKVTFNNCNFTGNEATNTGGSIWTDKNVVFNDIIISDSIAGGMGGGMYVAESFKYNNLTFINNLAENGGGLYWNKGNVNIEKINFINNTANKYGGALYIDISGSSATATTKVKNNNFTGNYAAVSGGAVYVNANFIVIQNNNFTKNSAPYGGAIYDLSTKGSSISDSYFAENNADYGGAIYSEYKGTEDHITKCYFIRNTAMDGGAIYLSNTNQKIGNCIFEGNNASRNGGCIFVSKDLSVTVHDSIFKHSRANNGGGIYYENSTSTKLSIDNNTFIKNVAFYNGGAVLYITNKHTYRDYNNFDNIPQAQVDPITHRTDVYSTDTSHNHFIITSLFEDNHDYILQIEALSDIETPTISVYLTSPRDGSKRFIRYIVNLTDLDTGNVTQFIVNETNYQNGHYDYNQNMFYVTFNNLKINQTYNITVGFYDENYMYKEISGNATAQGRKIGPFTLLQEQIERNITMQKKIDGITYYTIILGRDYTFIPYYLGDESDPLDKKCINLTNIDKPIVIIGNSHVVDADGYARIFNITSSNVTFINVQFINGNSSGKFGDKIDIGGAIYWSGANGTVIESRFNNNHAGRGGAIYFNASAENAEIINSSFINNVAETFGGAIDCNASNMGIYNNTFESNRADTGAALCRELNSTLGHGYNNTFRSNYALTNGSALAWIDAKNIHIDNYFFYDNSAGNSGGAIYVGKGSGNCEIFNCVFENNYITDPDGGHGGGGGN